MVFYVHNTYFFIFLHVQILFTPKYFYVTDSLCVGDVSFAFAI